MGIVFFFSPSHFPGSDYHPVTVSSARLLLCRRTNGIKGPPPLGQAGVKLTWEWILFHARLTHQTLKIKNVWGGVGRSHVTMTCRISWVSGAEINYCCHIKRMYLQHKPTLPTEINGKIPFLQPIWCITGIKVFHFKMRFSAVWKTKRVLRRCSRQKGCCLFGAGDFKLPTLQKKITEPFGDVNDCF